MPQATSQHETAFLSLPQAATYLGISPNTLYVWRRLAQPEHPLGYHRLGP